MQKVDVAGPGFINITLKPAAWTEALRTALRAGIHYGKSDFGRGEPVNVEYVSANPTGPMHVGHCRGAVFGDALANLLDFTGFKVTREYYINDAGAQVDVLARSAFLRYREALGEDIGAIPEGLYPGDYLKPVGAALAADYGRVAHAKARDRMAAARARQGDRHDDGDDPRGSRGAQRAPRRVLFRARRSPTARTMRSRARSISCAPQGEVYEGRLPPPKGAPVEDWEDREQTCFARPSSATTSTGRSRSRTAATPISPPISPITNRNGTAASGT